MGSKLYASREKHEAQIIEVKRQQELKTAATKAKMQAELDKVAAELAKIDSERKQVAELNAKMAGLNRLRGAKADKAELQQYKNEFENSQNAVSKVMNEEKSIQAAIMEKKLKQRQQRLLNSQKAVSVLYMKDEVIARLEYEKAQLESIKDITQLVEAIKRVNELQATLGELNTTLTN